MKPPSLRTNRLLLRRWTDRDRAPFADINADPEVMRYRLAPLSRHESDKLIEEIEACFDQNGFGLWAVERSDDGRLLVDYSKRRSVRQAGEFAFGFFLATSHPYLLTNSAKDARWVAVPRPF